MSTDKAVFNDLDADDKLEFKDFGQALRMRKLRIVRAKIGRNKKRPLGDAARPKRRVRRRLASPTPAGPAVPAAGEAPDRVDPEPEPGPPGGPNPEARHRSPNVQPNTVVWIPVPCHGCGNVAGSYKLYDHTQLIETIAPFWLFRCINKDTGRMATNYPLKRQCVISKMSEEDVVGWIQTNAGCCVRR